MKKKHIFLMMVALTNCFMGYAQNNAQEWGNFARYKQQNEALPDDKGALKRRVVFMGNSITENWVRMHPDFFTENGYIGRGISGQTSYQFLLRFREDVINLSPAIVVINAATNDIAENTGPYNEDYTFGNILSMIQLAQANGIKVILTSTLPAKGFGWNPNIKDAPQKIISLNKRLQDYANKHHIPFVDYYTKMVDNSMQGLPSQYSEDGVHPTIDGYNVMETIIKPIIDKELKKRR